MAVESENAPASSTRSSHRPCVRCGGPSTLVQRRTVAHCTPCAQKGIQQRAKAVLEHARGAALLDTIGGLDGFKQDIKGKQRERGGVALAFSGGGSSRVLLDVATQALVPPSQVQSADLAGSSGSARKSRPVDVTHIDVIYVDDSAIIPGARDLTDEVRQIVMAQGGAEAGLVFIPVKLEDVFNSPTGPALVECFIGPAESRSLRRTISSGSTPRELLQALFQSVNPPNQPRAAASTSRTRAEDLHNVLIQCLLRQVSSRLGDAALLLGDNASRAAINLIDGVAKGRGHKWAVEGATIMWIHDLLVLRPLRDCHAKELAFYNQTTRLQFLTPRDLVAFSVLGAQSQADGLSGVGEKASIGRLTENFIFSLEKGVPSTVNTVGRTGSKLALKEAKEEIAPLLQATECVDENLSAAASSLDLSSGGHRSYSGSGLGQKASRLVNTVKDLPRWDGSRGCPLCGLPSQANASSWKGKLSIVGRLDKDGNIEKGLREETDSDLIALDELLCYACNLILDVPEDAHIRASSSGSCPVLQLPPFVLDAAQKRLHNDLDEALDDKAALNGDMPLGGPHTDAAEEGIYASADRERRQMSVDGTHGNGSGRRGGDGTSAGHVTRRIGPEEMKGRVGSFLLDHD